MLVIWMYQIIFQPGVFKRMSLYVSLHKLFQSTPALSPAAFYITFLHILFQTLLFAFPHPLPWNILQSPFYLSHLYEKLFNIVFRAPTYISKCVFIKDCELSQLGNFFDYHLASHRCENSFRRSVPAWMRLSPNRLCSCCWQKQSTDHVSQTHQRVLGRQMCWNGWNAANGTSGLTINVN